MKIPEGWKLVPARKAHTDCSVVCLASQSDGITCPEDSCDIEDGVRSTTPPAAKDVSVKRYKIDIWHNSEYTNFHPEFIPDENGDVCKYAELPLYSSAQEDDLHPATADLVNRFSHALAEKLAAAENKYGYSDGWASSDWMDECRKKLLEHVAKGDPRDVAAYCAFLWHHGESTAPAQEDEPFTWVTTDINGQPTGFSFPHEGNPFTLTPLYTRPDSELRKASEEMLNVLDDPNPTGMGLLNARDNLRAALEKGKS